VKVLSATCATTSALVPSLNPAAWAGAYNNQLAALIGGVDRPLFGPAGGTNIATDPTKE